MGGADLKTSEYSPTVLGLIFLRYADVRFTAVEAEMGRDRPPGGSTSRREIGPADYHAAGVIYLPKTYRILDSRTLASLLKTVASISMDKGGDTFGLIYYEDFKEQLEALNEEFEVLNNEARELDQQIAENVVELLETA